MELTRDHQRQQAHAYLDQLPEAQVTAVHNLLESMLSPFSRALANAPMDDEPITPEEEIEVAQALEELRQNKGIPLEQVLTEFGITMEEIRNYKEPS